MSLCLMTRHWVSGMFHWWFTVFLADFGHSHYLAILILMTRVTWTHEYSCASCVAQAATGPAISYLLGRWSPPDERSMLFSIANTGLYTYRVAPKNVSYWRTFIISRVDEVIFLIEFGYEKDNGKHKLGRKSTARFSVHGPDLQRILRFS